MKTSIYRTAMACLVCLVITTRLIAAERRPNIIILMPDQMRGQAMGCAGNPDVLTPNLDKLASQGLYLPNTVANTCVCSPARAIILTGTYAHTNGVITNDLRMRESNITIAEVLADNGYATGFIAKWHLDGGIRHPGFIPPGPRRQGFQFWAANSCNHNHFDYHYFYDTPRPIQYKEFETRPYADEAIKFIRQNEKKPFFLWWAVGPPHNPYKGPPEFEKLYNPDTITMRPNWKPTPTWGTKKLIASYYAQITALDKDVGRILKVLDELNLNDDTIVLFTSDHGDMLGAHGHVLKGRPWEESIIVPGIIRWPGRIKAGQKKDWLFSHVDFTPTLLGMCGIKIPKDVQGRDLSNLFTRQGGQEQEGVYCSIHHSDYMVPDERLYPWRGIRTTHYMYAIMKGPRWVQYIMYDLQQDPYQFNNVVDDPAYAEARAKLDALLKKEMARTGDYWNPKDNFIGGLGVKLDAHPAVYHPNELKEKLQDNK
ncbi:MAG: sulfatase family protein [Planctomycetota bacterium]|jgi:arylsulfatase A-like enzyme